MKSSSFLKVIVVVFFLSVGMIVRMTPGSVSKEEEPTNNIFKEHSLGYPSREQSSGHISGKYSKMSLKSEPLEKYSAVSDTQIKTGSSNFDNSVLTEIVKEIPIESVAKNKSMVTRKSDPGNQNIVENQDNSSKEILSLKGKVSSAVPRNVPRNVPGNISRNDDVLILLSQNRSVRSDVRGNLGHPSVITNERVSDWLKDRWQGERLM